MTTPPTLQLNPEFGPMLFADCPFCLAPVPLDAATGTMECQRLPASSLELGRHDPRSRGSSRQPPARPGGLRRLRHRQAGGLLGQPAGGLLAPPDVEQRRLLDPASVERQRAARVEAAARRDVRRVRRLADEDRPLQLARPRRAGRATGDTETSACVYGLRGRRITCSAGPISMILPRYITAIRSARTQATDRSWVMNR